MTDVIIVGAGPAGALAATILARRGLRVTVFDRARFPRPKLCGDTLNPGALAILAQHLPIDPILAIGQPLNGMVLTGPGGVRVDGRYQGAQQGRSITRADLDLYLVQQAREAGAVIEEGVRIAGPLVSDDGVDGVLVGDVNGATIAQHARLVIGADGRESRMARALRLSSFAPRPRRWALGAYYEQVGADRSRRNARAPRPLHRRRARPRWSRQHLPRRTARIRSTQLRRTGRGVDGSDCG